MSEQVSVFDPESEVNRELFVNGIFARLSIAITPEHCQALLDYIHPHTNDPILYLLYLACFVKAKHVACGAMSASDNDRVIHAARHFKDQVGRVQREDVLVKKIIEYYNSQICTLVIKNVWMPGDYRQLEMWIVS